VVTSKLEAQRRSPADGPAAARGSLAGALFVSRGIPRATGGRSTRPGDLLSRRLLVAIAVIAGASGYFGHFQPWPRLPGSQREAKACTLADRNHTAAELAHVDIAQRDRRRSSAAASRPRFRKLRRSRGAGQIPHFSDGASFHRRLIGGRTSSASSRCPRRAWAWGAGCCHLTGCAAVEDGESSRSVLTEWTGFMGILALAVLTFWTLVS
jgi:hypothetical protein